MSREKRLEDNWGLIYGLELAWRHAQSFSIIYTLYNDIFKENPRADLFSITGLIETAERAEELGVDFTVLSGREPADLILEYESTHTVSAVICDFHPLRFQQQEQIKLAAHSDAPVFEVDSHNIVPARVVSDHQEFGAHTLRIKIERLLPEFLTDFPNLFDLISKVMLKKAPKVMKKNTEGTREKLFRTMESEESCKRIIIGEEFQPGSRAGTNKLMDFIENKLYAYAADRNNPTLEAVSGLSPYFNSGQISPQRAALLISIIYQGTPLKNGILDELIVRRELSDNFCFYTSDYENMAGFPNWAKQSLKEHREDLREYIYTLEEFENSDTHDPLWNAAQKQLVLTGKMHGYMRMYWAKKILEWTLSPEQALKYAITLNDRYALDGRDPNGYAGCAWAIGGLHDRAWKSRPVFGKIRYMNYNGCKRKFDVVEYINKIESIS
ncbi:MAG: deoxyribodipyrimidine photo-lyase [Spirochaetales bacterium]|nr:deoxyribodipyrimidine photo-lyase [Spirochaetales bacterium]